MGRKKKEIEYELILTPPPPLPGNTADESARYGAGKRGKKEEKRIEPDSINLTLKLLQNNIKI